MYGFMWKATVRNVRRAFKEVNAFEREEIVYPRSARQHCWAHKTRDVLEKVKKADWEKVKRDFHRISYAKNRQLAT